MAGENLDEIVLNDADWYEENNMTLHSGDPVVSIDRETAPSPLMGETLAYDRLLLATGSDPIMIPLPGHKLDGVISFRDLDDVDRMLEESETGGSAVVIGGGLLGLEAANGLAKRGMDVTVLHLAGHLMERQLDPAAGTCWKKSWKAATFRSSPRPTPLKSWHRQSRRCTSKRRHRDPSQIGGDGRRYPPEHGAGKRCRAGSRARYPGRRFHDHL